MNQTHPFDAELAEIDPRTRRLALDELSAAESRIAITLLVLTPQDPIMALDLHVGPHEGGYQLTCPVPLPIVLMGPGIQEDGQVEPYAIGSEPCRCQGEHNENLWNPLGLPLVWYQGLVFNLLSIGNAFRNNVALNADKYCPWGLALLG